MLRKVLVIAVAALQVVIFGSLVTWRVAQWNEDGWIGMAYSVDAEVQREDPVPTFFWGKSSRQVEIVVPDGPADRAGIAVGDTVVSVAGVSAADNPGLRDLASSTTTGDRLSYRVEGPDGAREVVAEVEPPYRNPLVLAATATSVIVGSIFVLISLLVYWSRPKSKIALIFFLMCVFGAAEYLVYAVVEFDIPSLRGITPATIDNWVFFGLALVGFFAVAVVSTLLHLSLLFPRPRPVVESWPQVFIWIHTLPFLAVSSAIFLGVAAVVTKTPMGVVISGVVVASILIAAIVRLRRRAAEFGWWQAVRSHPWTAQALVVLLTAPVGLVLRLVSIRLLRIVVTATFALSIFVTLLFIMVYSVIIVITLFRSYRESGVDEKRQVRWPLWGTVTAVGSSIFLMIVTAVVSFFFGTEGYVDFTTSVVLNSASKLVFLLIPISLAFGIVKYRLMDIDLIIRKTVVYSAVTGFVLVVYLGLAGISGLALVRSAGVESQAATVIATLLVVVLFVPVRNRIQRLVDRLFFQREQDTEASIARITDVVTTSASLDALSLGVAEQVQQTLRCRTVAVMVRRAGSDRFSTEATVGLPDTAVHGLSLPASSPVFEGFETHVVVDRSQLTPEERHVAQRTAASRSVICRRGDEPIGLITIGRKLSREPFDDSDEVFLEAVAGQLAVGLGRLRGRRAELEFAQALQIQRSLLPAEIPQIAGVEVAARWQPAREVSGDYYDVLALDDHRLAICIGDVVGKGMPAALLMSNLQAAVKAVATVDADPAAVCRQVRSVVTSNLSGGKFVTFFFAVVDGADRRLRFTNCGHNQPALVRADGSIIRLSEGGPAFARLMREIDYGSGDIELVAGDRLVLFTDGVSEAVDGDGEQFGEDRIVELVVDHRHLPAARLETKIADTVLAHADGALQDDLTLVVVGVE
jgi:serine phosphatase RsbU (regulator of sigma subunit)